jgi:hypothetical protein
MSTRRAVLATAALLAFAAAQGIAQQAAAPAASAPFYNTVKQKLKDGKQVVGGTVVNPDPDIYCGISSRRADLP